MDLDDGYPQHLDRVANRHAGVSVGGWIYNQCLIQPAGGLNAIYERALAVGLESIHRHAQLAAQPAQFGVNLAQRDVPVNLGLAFAQQVQIRAVQDQNPPATRTAFCHSHSPAPQPPDASISAPDTAYP